MVVAIDAKVRAGHNVANLEEIEALEANRDHALLVTLDEGKFIKALSLLVNLDPLIVGNIAKNLILCLQTKLFTELRACPRTHDIMVPLLTIRRFESALHVIEHTITIEAHALEVTVLVERDCHNLFTGAKLFHYFVVGTVKDLDVTFVQRDHDKSIVA